MSRLWVMRGRVPETVQEAIQSFLEPVPPLRRFDVTRRLFIGEHVDAYVDGKFKPCRVEALVTYMPGLYSEPYDELVLLLTEDQRSVTVHRNLCRADSGEWFSFCADWMRFFGVPPPFRTLDEAIDFGWPEAQVRCVDGSPVRCFE